MLGRAGFVDAVAEAGDTEPTAEGANEAAAGLRLAPGRFVPEKSPAWLLSVATPADSRHRAA